MGDGVRLGTLGVFWLEADAGGAGKGWLVRCPHWTSIECNQDDEHPSAPQEKMATVGGQEEENRDGRRGQA